MNWQDRENRLRIAYALLVPAPVLFALRAALVVAGRSEEALPVWSLAVVGILSGIGMVVALWATWKGPEFWRATVAVAVALTGHYLVEPLVGDGLGSAMVYLGTGFLASLRRRAAAYAGIVAGLGAILRENGQVMLGNGFLAVGAIALAVFLALAALPPRPANAS